MAKRKDPNGYILYKGVSNIDGKPIVVISTGHAEKSLNEKTGHMLQVWILREDMSPHEAVQTGHDISVCGKCPHRGLLINDETSPFGTKNVKRSCYVKTFQAPTHVWRAYERGSYDEVTVYDIDRLYGGQNIRLGAYGDPINLPLWLIESLSDVANAITGYTHQWRDCDRGYAQFIMASADNNADRFWARSAGYRTFRVRGADESLGKKEIACPASVEMGKKTTCAECKACGGHNAKANADIAIMAHGALATNFYKRKEDFAYRKAA